MSALNFVSLSRVGLYAAIAVSVSVSVSVSVAFAQTPAVPAASALPPLGGRVEVPDGSPQLANEKVVSNTSVVTPGKGGASVIVDEERVQGRLSSAHVSFAGSKGYTIVDPNAGRTNRDATNGSKRVTASPWELLRF